jgi:hypothetical protein
MGKDGAASALAIFGAIGGFLLLQLAWHFFFKAAESPTGQASVRGILKLALGIGALLMLGMCVSITSRGDDPYGLGAEHRAQVNRYNYQGMSSMAKVGIVALDLHGHDRTILVSARQICGAKKMASNKAALVFSDADLSPVYLTAESTESIERWPNSIKDQGLFDIIVEFSNQLMSSNVPGHQYIDLTDLTIVISNNEYVWLDEV